MGREILQLLVREPLAGFLTLPRAFFLIRGSRRLILLTLASVLATAAFVLCCLGFGALLVLPAAARGPLDNIAIIACLLLGVVTIPIFGPLASIMQLRTVELATESLGGPGARQVPLAWWVKSTLASGFRLLLARVLILAVTGLLASLVSWAWALLLGPVSRETFFTVSGAIAITSGMAVAFVTATGLPRLEAAARWRALRHLPRFGGYWLAMSGLSIPIILLLPTLGPVAGLLWSLDADPPAGQAVSRVA